MKLQRKKLIQPAKRCSNLFGCSLLYAADIMQGCGSHQIVERISPAPIDPNNKAGIKDVVQIIKFGPVFVTLLLFLGVYTISQIQSTMGAYYVKYYADSEGL